MSPEQFVIDNSLAENDSILRTVPDVESVADHLMDLTFHKRDIHELSDKIISSSVKLAEANDVTNLIISQAADKLN